MAVFWHEPIKEDGWLAELRAATEADGVRILKHRFIKPGIGQFVASSRPDLSPERLVRSVKGRLQHLVRRRQPRAFRRNYGLRSIGSATRERVEQYVRSQAEHHPMADPRVQETLRAVQIDNPRIDLSAGAPNVARRVLVQPARLFRQPSAAARKSGRDVFGTCER